MVIENICQHNWQSVSATSCTGICIACVIGDLQRVLQKDWPADNGAYTPCRKKAGHTATLSNSCSNYVPTSTLGDSDICETGYRPWLMERNDSWIAQDGRTTLPVAIPMARLKIRKRKFVFNSNRRSISLSRRDTDGQTDRQTTRKTCFCNSWPPHSAGTANNAVKIHGCIKFVQKRSNSRLLAVRITIPLRSFITVICRK